MSTELQTVEEPNQPKSTVTKASNALSAAWTYRAVFPSLLATGVKYYAWGPPQESWSIETALFIAGVKSLGNVRSKSGTKPEDVDPVKATQAARKRLKFVEMHDVKNGATADVEVPVRKNAGLSGILEQPEKEETGDRTIEAEWQLHNNARTNPSDRVVLYFHGGAYTLLNRRCQRPITLLMSKMLNSRILSVDYRLSPETPFPGGLHDAVSAYLYLTKDIGVPPENIIVSGDSAGGGLSLALMLYLRDAKLPMIGGAILISPWCDPSSSLASWESNQLYDYLDMPKRNLPMNPARCYLGSDKYDERILHPYVASCLADLSGLPPLLIQAGGAETLRDEATLLAQRAAHAGVPTVHQVFDGGIHVFQAFVKTDAAVAAFKAMKEWAQQQREPSKGGDWADADRRLEDAFKARDEKLAARSKAEGGKPASHAEQEKVVKEPRFVFEGVRKAAPEVNVRADGFEQFNKALDEVKSRGHQDVTWIFEARRNDKADGIVGKVRGLLHL